MWLPVVVEGLLLETKEGLEAEAEPVGLEPERDFLLPLELLTLLPLVPVALLQMMVVVPVAMLDQIQYLAP